MGIDAAEEVEIPLHLYSFKVHHSMCGQLMKLVLRINQMFPRIEASRPRCSSGIQSLVSLSNALDRAKQLLQYCSESSKLYLVHTKFLLCESLVITGEVVVARFLRSRNLMVQSLAQIQTMVPMILAAEISPIIDDLEEANFVMETSEEEAGKVLLELLHHGTDSAESQMRAFQVGLSKLCIISQRDLVIEVRSIKKLLDKVGSNKSNKTKILKTLLYLLKKYKNSGLLNHRSSSNGDHGGTQMNTSDASVHDGLSEAGKHDEARANLLSHSAPPEQFRCPLSRRVMYDPVIIASGQTYERMWIQKWFDDGNSTCPKTKLQLQNFSIIPNTAMKDLILNWCMDYGISISEPMPCQSLDLSSDSFVSFGSSLNDVQFPLDISFRSLEVSYTSDAPNTKVVEGSKLKVMPRHDHRITCECCTNMHENDMKLLFQLSELHWESQCTVIQDMNGHLKCDCQVWDSESSRRFIEPLVLHLRDALDQCDIGAQKAGSKLLLALVNKTGSGAPCLNEDAYSLLASCLETEILEESVAILDALSAQPNCRPQIAASSAPVSLLKVFDREGKEVQERVVRILYNLSCSSSDVCSKLASLGCIPKLVPFMNDSNVARYCITLLKNLCDTEEARVSIAETNGCISSIAELLENGSAEEQEHAVTILLSLCAQRVQYCHLLMDEGVIPSLWIISMNGNDKAKVSALELLRQLRDIEYETEPETPPTPPPTRLNVAVDEDVVPQGKVMKFGFLKNIAGSLTSRRKR
ncbi:U-box domain-containing protein 5 [Linum perenne]